MAWNETKMHRSLERAREEVIRAAKRWVDFEDQGTIADTYAIVQRQERMARAVTRLQKLEGQARRKNG